MICSRALRIALGLVTLYGCGGGTTAGTDMSVGDMRNGADQSTGNDLATANDLAAANDMTTANDLAGTSDLASADMASTTDLAPGVAPTVTGVTPTQRSTSGVGFVDITGTGFTGATAVHFGTTASTSFTVDSDTQISATSPTHSAGTVHITVTTPAGTSATSSADQFEFVDCSSYTNSSACNAKTACTWLVAVCVPQS